MVHTIHKRRYEFRINDIFIQVLIFGLMPKWTDMLGAGQCCQEYFSNFLSFLTSTNVIGRLARTEFFNHFSIFFYSTESFELNKFN